MRSRPEPRRFKSSEIPEIPLKIRVPANGPLRPRSEASEARHVTITWRPDRGCQ